MEIEDQIHILNAGDSIYYESSKPHRVSNISDSVGITIWIDAPASF